MNKHIIQKDLETLYTISKELNRITELANMANDPELAMIYEEDTKNNLRELYLLELRLEDNISKYIDECKRTKSPIDIIYKKALHMIRRNKKILADDLMEG